MYGNAPVAVRGEIFGGNRRTYTYLRTYRTFKNEFTTEPYLRIIVHKKCRSAYAKFSCGIAPLKIETGVILYLVGMQLTESQLKNGSLRPAIV